MTVVADVIIIALAVWRVSHFMSNDTLAGPWDLLSKVRHALGVRYNESSEAYGANPLADAMLCMYCSSFWLGLIAGVAYMFLGGTVVIICLPIAIGSLALFANDFRER